MKSIGLNIILAQIGYFVAAEEFIYSPYHSIFTRINSNDNIYKGLSSFMVEMIELTSILKRNNSNTLVLGDEICKGTENKSANIIVAYMLKKLSESKTSFITATHLHELINLKSVNEIENVKPMHLKITYDENNDELIYDRELSEGSGESFYGLQVAKYLMKDKNFNQMTNLILNEYNNINYKQSKYNNSYLINCEICKSDKNLESHHIIFQKDFDDKNINKNKFHYQKDANYNLVTLCRTCHDDVDRNKIIIYGWEETNNLRKLNYIYNNEPKKENKYSKELIDYIKLLKNENNDNKIISIKIKEKYNKKLSVKTIDTI
jgi:DNA mismatch repair protein MutS